MKRRINIGDHTFNIINKVNLYEYHDVSIHQEGMKIFRFTTLQMNTLGIFRDFIRYLCFKSYGSIEKEFINKLRIEYNFNYIPLDNLPLEVKDKYYSEKTDLYYTREYLQSERELLLTIICKLNIEFRGVFDFCKEKKVSIQKLPIRLSICDNTIIPKDKNYTMIPLAIEHKIQLVHCDDAYYYYC
jgi:hypothetical protein